MKTQAQWNLSIIVKFLNTRIITDTCNIQELLQYVATYPPPPLLPLLSRHPFLAFLLHHHSILTVCVLVASIYG